MELTKDSISVNPSSANCDTHCAYRSNNVQRKRKKEIHASAHTDVTAVIAEFNDYSLK